MMVKKRKSNTVRRGEENVKKITLLLLCLLVLAIPTFGQINEFELPVESVHLLSVEGQRVTMSDNVLVIPAIEIIDYTIPDAVASQSALINNYLMSIHYNDPRLLTDSYKGVLEDDKYRANHYGLGGVAVRLKGPMYVLYVVNKSTTYRQVM